MNVRPVIARTRGPGEAPAQARTRNLTCEAVRQADCASRRPPADYCSDKCRIREFDRRRVKKSGLGGDTGGPTKCIKIAKRNQCPAEGKNPVEHPYFGPFERNRH